MSVHIQADSGGMSNSRREPDSAPEALQSGMRPAKRRCSDEGVKDKQHMCNGTKHNAPVLQKVQTHDIVHGVRTLKVDGNGLPQFTGAACLMSCHVMSCHVMCHAGKACSWHYT